MYFSAPRRYPGQAQHAIAEEASCTRTGNSNTADLIAAARGVLEALAVARAGIISMRETLSRMPVGCHPLIFYQRVRPFLSGWKANPTLPDGVLYEVCCVTGRVEEGPERRVRGRLRGEEAGMVTGGFLGSSGMSLESGEACGSPAHLIPARLCR